MSLEPPPVGGVHEAALYATDLDEIERFWRRVGLQFISRVEGRHVFFRIGRDLLLTFDAEATRREGGEVPPHGASGAGHVAFDVPDEAALAVWRDHLTRIGVPIEAEIAWPRGGRSLYFRDPAGNNVELITRGTWGF